MCHDQYYSLVYFSILQLKRARTRPDEARVGNINVSASVNGTQYTEGSLADTIVTSDDDDYGVTCSSPPTIFPAHWSMAANGDDDGDGCFCRIHLYI